MHASVVYRASIQTPRYACQSQALASFATHRFWRKYGPSSNKIFRDSLTPNGTKYCENDKCAGL